MALNDPDFTGWSLTQAQQWLEYERDNGVHCPCCKQFVKVYNRKLHSGMAVALIHMYNHRNADDKFDITTHVRTKNGDTAKLREWGLITQDEHCESGVWKVTELGKQFVTGRVRVPSHGAFYIGTFLVLNGDDITIVDALGSKFDYNELMRERWR